MTTNYESKWNYKSWKHIDKKLKKQNLPDDFYEYLKKQILNRDERIDSLIKSIEYQNKTCCDFSKRYLEVFRKDTNVSKLTINPVVGRFTIKISDKASVKVEQDLVNFVDKHIFNEDFDPCTIRGKFKFKENKYNITLTSDSKKYSRYFEMEI